MELIEIMRNIYCNPSLKWVEDVEDNEISPFVINMWLSMNEQMAMQSRYLDKFTFNLPPKMFLTLAWSVVPKHKSMPYAPFIKKKKQDTELIFQRIRKHFEMSDNDFNSNKQNLINEINKNKTEWNRFYAIKGTK